MSFSYSGNPADSPLDAVRFLIGDTDPNDPLLQDEEIEYLLEISDGNVIAAAIRGCYSIAAKFSREAKKRLGDYSISAEQKAKNYLNLAEQLKQEETDSQTFKSIPYAGGISVSDKIAVENNPDRVKPAFRRGMFNADGYRE